MEKACRPIGFFDSGLGGISVLKTAYNLLPNENYIYYSDAKNAPYGERSEHEIKELTLAAGKVLFDRGVKAIVIACNTATSAAVKLMRQQFNIPVISMEPAVKPALDTEGKVLVLATPATVTQRRYNKLLERLDSGDKVINVGCSRLVELIESGKTDEDRIEKYFSQKLTKLKNERIGAVVLGCTHYSFIQQQIISYVSKNINEDVLVFDGRFGTSKQLLHVLEVEDMLCKDNKEGSIEFITSGKDNLIAKYKHLFQTF